MSKTGFSRVISRYSVVSAVLAKVGTGMGLADAIEAVCRSQNFDVNGRPLCASPRTLYRWVAAYKTGGFESLADRSRISEKPAQVLSGQFIDFLKREKEADHHASIPEVIRRAREEGIVDESSLPARSSVYRAAKKLNLPIFAKKGVEKKDMRRFAYKHRMQMVLNDGKHFRVGITRKKRVAMFFLDDATRFGLTVVVGSSETADLFLRGVWKLLRKWGHFDGLFVDNGSGFIADDTLKISAKLAFNLIHGTAGYPEGHGKIERFNQTALYAVLRSFSGNPEINPSSSGLELRLDHYLQHVYNRQPHESLGKRTPEEVFLSDQMALRPLDNVEKFRSHFIISERRRVSRDNIVKISGCEYEMPLGYAGRNVSIFRHVLDHTVSVLHEHQYIALSLVDKIDNARSGRRRKPAKKGTKPIPRKTAATRAFEKSFGSILDSQGNFQDKES